MLANAAYATTTDSAGFAYSQNPLDALASGAPELATVAQENPGASLFDIIERGLQLYAGHTQQRNFLEINRQLVAQGQAPISWEQFGAQTAVGVQLDSSTRKVLYLAVGGALLLGAFALLRRR